MCSCLCQGVMVLPKLYRVYKGYRMDSMTKSDKAAASLIYRTPESPASTRKPATGVSAAARTTRKISQISQDGDAWSLKSRHYLSSPDNQGHGMRRDCDLLRYFVIFQLMSDLWLCCCRGPGDRLNAEPPFIVREPKLLRRE